MAIVSILSTKPTMSMESQSILSSPSTALVGAPVLSEQAIISMLADEGQDVSHNTLEGLATELLAHSAHMDGTLGSPGTYLLTRQEGSKEGEGNFVALVVNQLGEKTTYPVKQFVGGWMVGKDTSVYKSCPALAQALLAGLEDVMGPTSAGIPFYSADKIQLSIEKLSKADAGTYTIFAHSPLTEIAKQDSSISAKRNMILWVNNDGNIEQAQFHFDVNSRRWLNGGPHIGHTAVLSDATLQGLIENKIALSLGRNGEAKLLKFDV